ncbi:MAG: hypothetical protein EOO04_16835, partial [Chitinophagaceae bacterium]
MFCQSLLTGQVETSQTKLNSFNPMVIIGGKQLTLNDFNNILFNNKIVSLDEAALLNVSENHSFLRRFSDHKLIYGINTGFGPMAQFKV